MKEYLKQRLETLRLKYKENADIKWLHRFNECYHILEKLEVMEMEKNVQKQKIGRAHV